jgi:hypothetical protein
MSRNLLLLDVVSPLRGRLLLAAAAARDSTGVVLKAGADVARDDAGGTDGEEED